MAKATGLLVDGLEDMIDEKIQLSGTQKGTATPDAPTRPPTTVQSYNAALSGGGGRGSTPSTASPGGKVPDFNPSAKVDGRKIKVLGISR